MSAAELLTKFVIKNIQIYVGICEMPSVQFNLHLIWKIYRELKVMEFNSEY